MKKLFPALAASAAAAGTAFAQEASTAVQWSGSVAEDIVTDASSTLTNFLTGAGTLVASVVVAGLAIWGAIALVGIVKRAFSTGKGR